MPLSGAGRRRKGHDFERFCASELRAVFPKARRGLQYQDGNCPPDVIETPYHIECKKGKRTDIKAAMEQARRDSAARGLQQSPVAITKEDDKPALVTLDFELWLAMLASIYGRQDGA